MNVLTPIRTPKHIKQIRNKTLADTSITWTIQTAVTALARGLQYKQCALVHTKETFLAAVTVLARCLLYKQRAIVHNNKIIIMCLCEQCK